MIIEAQPAAVATGFISVVVPVLNEEENIDPLCAKLFPALEELGRPFEVIIINDGSWDRTEEKLAAQAEREPRLTVVSFRRNVGQTAALMAGIDYARGDIIVPMDGDLQNDPRDIGDLLAKIDEGYDVVSGWRKERHDSLSRTFPSRVANKLISEISGVHLHDYGCSLKAYRRDVLRGFRLYGQMHRLVPIYARWQGARIAEIPVRHHARQHGRSKYGMNRVFKVLLDLMLAKFLTQYETTPIYVFGMAGVTFFLMAFVAGIYAIYLKYWEHTSFIQTPLPLLVTLGFITGVMCLLLGLLAEMQVRIYFESQGKLPYQVKTINHRDENK
jgi:glycosyltransferase involved in cell wall biosynthesis